MALIPDPSGRPNHYRDGAGNLYVFRAGQTEEEFFAEMAQGDAVAGRSQTEEANYHGMIRRRAHALAEGGDEVGALLELKKIGE